MAANYVAYAGLGVACVIAAPLLAPSILGGIFGVSAAGPVAGGVFAGLQAAAPGGVIAAGAPLAVIQGIAMGAPLPAIGFVGAGAVGVVVARAAAVLVPRL
ncbi:hypothetical protein CPB85DRAFT_1310061 [Mucidula mucida]|nr:hypothetical protein CPB85DRAFT_1310061 [Mucidula mucida]